MLIIPMLSGGVLFFNLATFKKLGEGEDFSLRKTVIEMMIILGSFLALSSEILSLFDFINITGVASAWSLFLLINSALACHKQSFKRGWQRIHGSLRRLTGRDWFFVGLIALILLLTLLTGLLAPPNNYDSLLYHLPRVAHWIQNGNLSHYPGSYINQLAFPVLAEEGILTLWLLNGSDKLSSLVQWLTYMGSLAAVSYLAKQLGAPRAGQWLATFFALSLPGALLQSSSTQNDMVTAFWFACFLVYLVIQLKRPLGVFEFCCCSAALGLGLLTKGTFYLYIAVPGLIWLYLVMRNKGLKRSLPWVAGMLAIIMLLNSGFWIRNLITFKTPLGTSVLINSLVSHKAQAMVFLNPVRDLMLNLLTPYETFNHRMLGWLFAPSGTGGGALPDWWVVFSWNDEDHAGNPVHLLLILLCLVIYIFSKKQHHRCFTTFIIALLISFLIFSLGLQYNAYLVRLELPFFIGAAALFGYVSGNLLRRDWLWGGVLVLFILLALPYSLINKYRPLIALRDNPEPLSLPAHWVTGKTTGSIILEPDTITFFAHFHQKHDPYIQMSELITAKDCRDIGLRIDSSDPEYPFWWLLKAPLSGYRLEAMNILPETERYIDAEFKPCVVICTVCDDRPERFGLKLAGQFDNALLYLEGE
ncbi:MAG: hypothetical protein JW704_10320 [Anaerolineaceae bacterium]|nr:hypothetical protein [Anaerolineaceae bacterium]MBN2677261.1 hypothetical protein [Anaerolineaceae bacterium]